MTSPACPLCVDLDGTLLRSDSLWEAFLVVLKRKPWLVFAMPFWVMGGLASAKQKIAVHAVLDVSHLPYHRSFLDYLYEQKRSGRHLVLATATDKMIAERVAAHLGLFQEVLASDGVTNLAGSKKAALLKQKFGDKGFAYAGNEHRDLKVWSLAQQAVVVNGPKSLVRAVERIATVEAVFDDRVYKFAALVRSMRPHQWLENLLIFVPLVTAHAIGQPDVLIQGLIAFASFCLCTSSVYLLNDLLDLESDRKHSRKHRRALASGELPIPLALIAIPILFIGSLFLTLLLPALFTIELLTYFALTILYSFYFKQLILIDVLLLASLYTIRILAGHAATGLPYSFWLLLFSMFLFFSLALVKRYSELENLSRQQRDKATGRGYSVEDREEVSMLGISSGLLAVLVLALYVNSDAVTRLYARPQFLWLLCPVMLYWISRLWLLARRGMVHEDPILFTLKDYVSYVVLGIVGVVMLGEV